jgi:hypothetical protein
MDEHATRESVSLLTLEFLSWISIRPRSYLETMEAWRSACPRNSVWEDVLIDGLIQIESGGAMNRSKVILTLRGRTVLERRSPSQNG